MTSKFVATGGTLGLGVAGEEPRYCDPKRRNNTTIKCKCCGGIFARKKSRRGSNSKYCTDPKCERLREKKRCLKNCLYNKERRKRGKSRVIN